MSEFSADRRKRLCHSCHSRLDITKAAQTTIALQRTFDGMRHALQQSSRVIAAPGRSLSAQAREDWRL